MSTHIKNLNQLEAKSVQLIIDRTPHVNYFCTSAAIPGISATPARQHSMFTDVKHTGDKLIYQPLIVSFLVDEKMENWSEIHNWMVSYAHPTSFDEYYNREVTQNQLYSSKKSDAKLLVPNNKYNNAHEFTFVDVFPIDLTDVVIDVQVAETQSLLATLTLEYSYYTKTA